MLCQLPRNTIWGREISSFSPKVICIQVVVFMPVQACSLSSFKEVVWSVQCIKSPLDSERIEIRRQEPKAYVLNKVVKFELLNKSEQYKATIVPLPCLLRIRLFLKPALIPSSSNFSVKSFLCKALILELVTLGRQANWHMVWELVFSPCKVS